MKLRNTLPLLLAVLSCACSQTNGENASNPLRIDSYEGYCYFDNYGSWRIFLYGLHSIYGEKGFYGIVPALEAKTWNPLSFEITTPKGGEPISIEKIKFYDAELDSEHSSEEGSPAKENSLDLCFYLTEKNDESPSIKLKNSDDTYDITITLQEKTIGEGTLSMSQNLSEDYVRDYLTTNMFFA